jgi:HSP20 family molecular chaperone IbpA
MAEMEEDQQLEAFGNYQVEEHPPTEESNAPAGWEEQVKTALNTLLENFGRTIETATEAGKFMPSIEVFEREGQFVVRTDLPGLTAEELTIEIEDFTLVIKGERRYEEEGQEGRFYFSERRYGRFSRSIPLPEGVDVDSARAEFRNGVLEVAMNAPQGGTRRFKLIELRHPGQVTTDPRPPDPRPPVKKRTKSRT